MSEYRIVSSDELYHYGIRGQRWGVRRFQNENGSLTDAGKKRYQRDSVRGARKIAKDLNTLDEDLATNKYRLAKAKQKGAKSNIKKYSEATKATEKAISNLLETAKKRGLHLDKQQTYRNVTKGEMEVAAFIAGLPGIVVEELVSRLLYGNTALAGTRYKARRG